MTQVVQLDIDALRQELRGPALGPEDTGYDEGRAVWNGSFDKRPAAVVRPTGTADVVAAVNFARENELLLAVKGGGHSLPGYSTCDDGMLIDLSLMQGVFVDEAARTARAQGGVQWGLFDRETQARGLAVTGG